MRAKNLTRNLRSRNLWGRWQRFAITAEHADRRCSLFIATVGDIDSWSQA